MARDLVMLEAGHQRQQAMWRVYGWNEPALTFGYSQTWETIQQWLAGFDGVCIRRATGGGIVDHRNDLTYALSLPAVHPFHHRAALELYRELHAIVAAILSEAGFPAEQALCPGPCKGERRRAGGVCFQAAEPYDVIDARSRRKIAGAAMKRNALGILVQGSLDRSLVNGLDGVCFEAALASRLADWLGVSPSLPAEPLPEDDLIAEAGRFSSDEWNRRR